MDYRKEVSVSKIILETDEGNLDFKPDTGTFLVSYGIEYNDEVYSYDGVVILRDSTFVLELEHKLASDHHIHLTTKKLPTEPGATLVSTDVFRDIYFLDSENKWRNGENLQEVPLADMRQDFLDKKLEIPSEDVVD